MIPKGAAAAVAASFFVVGRISVEIMPLESRDRPNDVKTLSFRVFY